MINSGGTLSPGDNGVGAGAGTLTIGALTLNAGALLAFNLGAPNTVGGALNDLLVVNGNVTIGAATLNITDSGALPRRPASIA